MLFVSDNKQKNLNKAAKVGWLVSDEGSSQEPHEVLKESDKSLLIAVYCTSVFIIIVIIIDSSTACKSKPRANRTLIFTVFRQFFLQIDEPLPVFTSDSF